MTAKMILGIVFAKVTSCQEIEKKFYLSKKIAP
jgi:hypothetical protein